MFPRAVNWTWSESSLTRRRSFDYSLQESPAYRFAIILCIDLAKPKSGALVSLFSSPLLYWTKTVTRLFITGFRRVSLRGFRNQSRWLGGGEELTRSATWERCPHNLQLASQWFFKQPGTFVVVPDVLSKFSKIGNVFFFRWSVWCQHQLKLYFIERDL